MLDRVLIVIQYCMHNSSPEV